MSGDNRLFAGLACCERALFRIESQPALLLFGAVTLEAMLFEEGTNVFFEIDGSGGGNTHGERGCGEKRHAHPQRPSGFFDDSVHFGPLFGPLHHLTGDAVDSRWFTGPKRRRPGEGAVYNVRL